jgi:hypothetical protein
MKKYIYTLALILFVACSKDRIITLAPAILGCTNVDAANFNPDATEDDGGCVFAGCTDSVAINFDPVATIDDGSCLYDGLIGCSDTSAINYDSAAIGCGSPPSSSNLDCCVYPIYGCTDPLAMNYSSTANTDDGSCVYPTSFANDVMPIFNDQCVVCHGVGTPYPLQLTPQKTAYNELVAGGSAEGEPYINTKNPTDSYLYQLISGDNELVMPLNEDPLTDQQIQVVLTWIEQGAQNN